MPTLTLTRLRGGRGVLMLLPWVMLIAVVAGCVSRELIHRGQIDRIGEIEQLLTGVSKSANNQAEREAMRRLAQWTLSKGMGVSISAYTRLDGRKIPIAEVSNRKGNEMAFEVKFDVDGDHMPERAYHLCLKDPQHIGMLMME